MKIFMFILLTSLSAFSYDPDLSCIEDEDYYGNDNEDFGKAIQCTAQTFCNEKVVEIGADYYRCSSNTDEHKLATAPVYKHQQLIYSPSTAKKIPQVSTDDLLIYGVWPDDSTGRFDVNIYNLDVQVDEEDLYINGAGLVVRTWFQNSEMEARLLVETRWSIDPKTEKMKPLSMRIIEQRIENYWDEEAPLF